MKHEPIVREMRMLRFLGAAATFLTALALLSTLAIIITLNVDAMDAAWHFLWALIGCAVTLIAVGYVEGRMVR